MNPTHRFAAALFVSLAASAVGQADPSAGYLLVANKGDATLSIVDVDKGQQVAAVKEDGITGHEVAATPDGSRAFVPIYSNVGVGSAGTDGQLIRIVDVGRHSIVGTIDFGRGIRPHRPLYDPTHNLLYVTTELEHSVTVIDPDTLKVLGAIPTGFPESHMLAISSDGKRGYTANVRSGTVSVLDLEARKLITTIQVAPRIQRISISTDNRTIFTADQTALRLVAIDTSNYSVVASVPLPGLAFGTATTPDGRSLLATVPALNLVCLVDLSTMRVVRRIEVPKAPQEILVRPDGAFAYVSCDSAAQVAVIDLKQWTIAKLIPVGPMDDGLAWAPRD
jgi:YVTN family beta-propeller protein